MVCIVYKVNIKDEAWCEYEPNQTADCAVNQGFITSKTPVNNGCYNIAAYTEQQHTTGHVDNGCQIFQ